MYVYIYIYHVPDVPLWQSPRPPREIYRLVEEDERAIYVPFGEALEKRSGEGCAAEVGMGPRFYP